MAPGPLPRKQPTHCLLLELLQHKSFCNYKNTFWTCRFQVFPRLPFCWEVSMVHRWWYFFLMRFHCLFSCSFNHPTLLRRSFLVLVLFGSSLSLEMVLAFDHSWNTGCHLLFEVLQNGVWRNICFLRSLSCPAAPPEAEPHTYIHTYIQTYIHTYIHTYEHIWIYIPRYTYIHTYIHTYTHIHTYIHTYTNIFEFTYLDTRTYIHTYKHTYIHTYIHTYVRTYIHTHTYIHTYIYT